MVLEASFFGVKKKYLFYHCQEISDWRDKFVKTYEKLSNSGLLLNLDKFFVHFDGDDVEFFKDFKEVILIKSSKFENESETSNLIRDFSKKNKGYVLYLNNKENFFDLNYSKEKIKYLVKCNEFFCVENWKLCVQKLDSGFDVVGIDYFSEYYSRNRFLINFWWAKTDYISKLRKASKTDKYDSEFWIVQNMNAKTCSLFDCNDIELFDSDQGAFDYVQGIQKKSWPYSLLSVPSAWKGLEDYLIMISYVFNISLNKALDFGVDYGYSTHILSKLFRKVIGVDHFKGDCHAGERDENFFDKVKANFENSNVKLINSDFKDFISKNKEKYDLIHIDLVHFYEDTFQCAEWAVNHSDLVILHDTMSYSEIYSVCEDISKKYDLGFLNIPFHNGLGILYNKRLLNKTNRTKKQNIPINVFYHCHAVNDWKDRFFVVYNQIKNSGLLNELQTIFVHFDGDELDFFDQFMKISLTQHKQKFVSEATTILDLQRYAEKHNSYLLYLHGKGVTYDNGAYNFEFINDWFKFLNYFNIQNWRECVSKLGEGFDVVGVSYRVTPHVSFAYRHYSGNYWWTKSKYVNKLRKISNDVHRNECEGLICEHLYAKKCSLFNASVDHYIKGYPASEYDHMIQPIPWPYETLCADSNWKGLEKYLISIIYKFKVPLKKALSIGLDEYVKHCLSHLFEDVSEAKNIGEAINKKYNLTHINITQTNKNTQKEIEKIINNSEVVLIHNTNQPEIKKIFLNIIKKNNLFFTNISYQQGLGIISRK